MCPIFVPSAFNHHFLVDCKLTNYTVIPVQFKNHPLLCLSGYPTPWNASSDDRSKGHIRVLQPSHPCHLQRPQRFHTEHVHSKLLTSFQEAPFWNSPVKLQSMNVMGSRTQSSTATASQKTLLGLAGRVICFKVLS